MKFYTLLVILSMFVSAIALRADNVELIESEKAAKVENPNAKAELQQDTNKPLAVTVFGNSKSLESTEKREARK